MIEPSVVTQPLGGSALSRDARAGLLPQWYAPVPQGPKAWKEHARRVAESVPAGWFDQLELAIAPAGGDGGGLAMARLRRSVGGHGFIVTTGQQAGLFGGPLMTFIKAVSARALADVLEETIGAPVAPLFWAATDDADFDEAATVSTVLGSGVREMRLEHRPPAGTPMAFTPIGAEVDDLARVLREACGSAPNRSSLECAVEAFRAGNTVGAAYVALMRAVLEPVGIAVLDVSHESMAKAAASGLHRLAQQAPEIAAAVARRTAEISAAGYDPQVEEVPGLSLVSIHENHIKRRLPFAEAVRLARPNGGATLSSTVLVRPVLERMLLPTLGYLGGPGEVAYFAQVSAVAESLGVAAPLVLPRWSATIVEPHVRRVLDEVGIRADDLADPHAVEGRLARAQLAPDADHALRQLRGDLESGVARLAAVNGGLVPPAVLDGLRRSLEHRLARLERRLLAGVKRRETEMMGKIARARGSLYPHGVRQERQLAFIPFLARYGTALVDEMIAAARLHARSLVSGAPAVSPKPSTPPARV